MSDADIPHQGEDLICGAIPCEGDDWFIVKSKDCAGYVAVEVTKHVIVMGSDTSLIMLETSICKKKIFKAKKSCFVLFVR